MKFTRYPVIIEAFKAGIDPIPDWFMDRVSSNEVMLKQGNKDGPWCVMMRWNGQEIEIKKGDYITNSLFPFVTYTPEHFEASYLLGDLAEVYSLGFELSNAIDQSALSFETKEEVYNSLYEDLRDLRRELVANNDLSELLLQIAVTALKARKDLFNEP